jgi:hypothetical protein
MIGRTDGLLPPSEMNPSAANAELSNAKKQILDSVIAGNSIINFFMALFYHISALSDNASEKYGWSNQAKYSMPKIRKYATITALLN